MSYVLGAKAESLSWWQFLIPVALSSAKNLAYLYLASQADNIQALLNGRSNNPANVAVTLVGLICAIVCFLLIGRLAQKRLKAMQAVAPSRLVLDADTDKEVVPDSEQPTTGAVATGTS